MIKVFTTNKNGKIEFTKSELEKLLNEVWFDGKNSHWYSWSSPSITTPYITTYCTSPTTSGITATSNSCTVKVGE